MCTLILCELQKTLAQFSQGYSVLLATWLLNLLFDVKDWSQTWHFILLLCSVLLCFMRPWGVQNWASHEVHWCCKLPSDFTALLVCLFKFALSGNVLPQWVQTLRCVIFLCFWTCFKVQNYMLHRSQVSGERVKWLSKLLFFENCSEHFSHWYFEVIFKWAVLLCCCRLSFLVKHWEQVAHLCSSPKWCDLSCLFRSLLIVNFLSHLSHANFKVSSFS